MATAERGEFREAPERARTVCLLRATLLIATSYLLIAEAGWRGLGSGLLALLALGGLSNLAPLWFARATVESNRFLALATIVDAAWVTGALLLTGRLEAEFFFLYLFVIFLAATGESLRWIVLGSLVVGGGYLAAITGVAGSARSADHSLFMRIPFLFTVALVYGHLVERIRRERGMAELERRAAAQSEARRVEAAEANLALESEVAERRRVEEALRKFARAVEQSPSAVLFLDGDGRIEYANPRSAAITGMNPERLRGRALTELAGVERGVETLEGAAAALRSGVGWSGELALEAADGSRRWLALELAPVRDPLEAGAQFVAVGTDVTARIEADEALRRANLELERTSEMKSTFVSTASHELRTPLTVIRGVLDLLEGLRGAALTEPERRFIAIARRNADRLTRIVRDLLDLSKVEAGRIELRFGRVDLPPLVNAMVAGFEATAAAAGVRLRAHCGRELPPVWADTHRLEQILTNLVGNALKFTPRGGAVDVRVESQAGEVQIEVADSGVGIALEQQPRIFEPFYQVGDGLTGKSQGAGLGLSIAQDLAHAHGTRIEVESEPGRGSRFRFGLLPPGPLAEEATELEAELRTLRPYPFSCLLVARALPGSEGDRDPSFPILVATFLRECMPRQSDRVLIQSGWGQVVLLLPMTTREGAEVLATKLRTALATLGAGRDERLAGVEILGPAVSPEDGRSGAQLLARAVVETRAEAA